MALTFRITGFRKNSKQMKGRLYRGRFTCPNVQWTGAENDLLATFTITADELADAAENSLLWTDQGVQRGIQPGVQPIPDRELCLAAGYPDPSKYIFDARNADDIVEKLLDGEKVFLNPLVWNLRPGEFEVYWDDKETSLYIYSGRVYLPDSHHRHQAIVKAIRTWRSSSRDYPRFSGDKEFKIELYFLSREDEGNYFFDKNQRPKPTSKSKAYDLTTLDDLSLLAKAVVSNSKNLEGNVNRVTDRLTRINPQVITLSTLREMMKSFASNEQLDASELEGYARVAAQFYDMLVEIRPELGTQDISSRRKIRDELVVDSAVMMHGYAALMQDFNEGQAKLGTSKAKIEWEQKLKMLSADRQYTFDRWRGDIFEKTNPLWQRLGIVKPGRDGTKLTVLNTGAARSECGRALRRLLSVGRDTKNLQFLTVR
jgi:hypothetical protein